MADLALVEVAAIFGGKGLECDVCVNDQQPFDLKVDVSARLAEMGISRYEAHVEVVLRDINTDKMHRLSETKLPVPSLVGPLFDQLDTPLSAASPPGLHTSGEVKALQGLLQTFGYFSGAVDGSYSTSTKDAVAAFQKYAKITPPDGIANGQTKRALLRRRFDLNADPPADVQAADGAAAFTPPFTPGQTVTYRVGASPGYLPRAKVLTEVAAMMAQWANATHLHFVRLREGHRGVADLSISWSELREGNALFFDGPGGKLAHNLGGEIVLDSAERWVLRGELPEILRDAKLGASSFGLSAVVLHEVGHALGLVHSPDPSAVMFAFYDPTKLTLAQGDLTAARKLYGPSPPPPTHLDNQSYVQQCLAPTLTNGLKALCAERPTAPVEWLALWLQSHNPNRPVAP